MTAVESGAVGRPTGDSEIRTSGGPDDMIVTTVVRLFERVLGRSVGPDENFFELGGDSMKLIELVESLFQVLDVDVATDDVFLASSPRRLAELCGMHRGPGLVARLGPTEGRPMFVIPAADGEVGWFLKHLLGAHLARPVVGLRAPGTLGRPMSNEISAFAAMWVEAIRSIQTGGSYTLVGYCAGGVVAWEVARQLIDAGEAVDELVLLDVGEPEYRRWELADAVRFRLDQLRRRDPVLQVAATDAIGEDERWLAAFEHEATEDGLDAVERYVLRSLRTFWAYSASTWDYHPSRLPVRSRLFYSEDFAPTEQRVMSISREWREAALSTELHRVQAAHLELFETPEVLSVFTTALPSGR